MSMALDITRTVQAEALSPDQLAVKIVSSLRHPHPFGSFLAIGA